ncbi:hypothetical protein [Lichenihabitans sp. PAMC28606]|uniref:hypothetical protein n=1 Tax=Lichenihabitans sp. PAMC28606 TaxID=2880932 RepID=UPI0029CAB662|nr:hypothetical protein [Lichenihabitans sp. PAMC28606]
MIKRLLLAGACLALLTPAVLAQVPPGENNQPGVGAPPPPPPPGGPGLHGPGGPGGPGMRGPGGFGFPPPPPPPPSKAAHFHLQRGDTVVDVKCADDEPVKACGDIASQLIDKLSAIPAVPAPVAPATPAQN